MTDNDSDLIIEKLRTEERHARHSGQRGLANLYREAADRLEKLAKIALALDSACINTAAMVLDYDKPKQSIDDLINWYVETALDPEVSKRAQDLIDTGANR